MQLVVQLHPMHLPGYVPGYRKTLGALLLPSRENIRSLGTAVQHNFRRTLLVPSREQNINSLGAAIQHDFRRKLLVPSREENIKRLTIAWAPQCIQARSQAKIPEGGK